MKKRHREVVNPFSIKTKKNRPDQSPVEHIKHASSQDETQRGRNRQPPIRSRDDAVGDGAACFRRTLDDRKQRLGVPMSPALSGPHKNSAKIIAEMPTDSSSSSHARNLVSSPKTAGVLALPNLRAANQ
jgi:hypothetical protein